MKDRYKENLIGKSITATPPHSPKNLVNVDKEARRRIITASYRKTVHENGKALEMLSKH